MEEDHGMHRVLRGNGGSRRSSSGRRVEGVVGVDGREREAFHAVPAHGSHGRQSHKGVDPARVQGGALGL